jgi:hypothetical protein
MTNFDTFYDVRFPFFCLKFRGAVSLFVEGSDFEIFKRY